MQSPLELDAELVRLVGLVTVRWAALEDVLGDVLGRFMRVNHAGDAALFSLANFSQRIDLITSVADYSIENRRDFIIVQRLMGKIRDLWNKRNYLLHSHYVHQTVYADGAKVTLVRSDGFPLNPEAVSSDSENVKSRSFGYIRRKGGEETFVPINSGALRNHAERVARRGRQLSRLVKAIDTGLIKMREDVAIQYRRVSPRSPLFKDHKPIPDGEAFVVQVSDRAPKG